MISLIENYLPVILTMLPEEPEPKVELKILELLDVGSRVCFHVEHGDHAGTVVPRGDDRRRLEGDRGARHW